MGMTTSSDGIALIKGFEGCKLSAYRDIKGIPTIGTGHTGPDVHMGMTITPDQADQILSNDLHKFEISVNNMVTVDLTQGQFDALVSFAFNLGAGNLHTSTLLKDVNNEDFDDAAQEFLKWDHAGPNVVAGLLRRRKAESAMFAGNDWQAIMNG
jgi:lysozyme